MKDIQVFRVYRHTNGEEMKVCWKTTRVGLACHLFSLSSLLSAPHSFLVFYISILLNLGPTNDQIKYIPTKVEEDINSIFTILTLECSCYTRSRAVS